MIEVVKMEPEDEKKEVLQYLKDHREVLADMAKCSKYAGDIEFDRMLADVMLSTAFSELDKFKETRKGEELGRFTRLLLVSLADIKLDTTNLLGGNIIDNATFAYDDETNSIIISVIEFGVMNSYADRRCIMAIDKLKNLIDDFIRNKSVSTDTYLMMLSNGYERAGAPYYGYTSVTSMPINMYNGPSLGIQPGCYPPYNQYMPPITSMPIPMYSADGTKHSYKSSKRSFPKCSHTDTDGKPTVYKKDPKNKTHKCTQCNRPIPPSQLSNLMKRYEEKLASKWKTSYGYINDEDLLQYFNDNKDAITKMASCEDSIDIDSRNIINRITKKLVFNNIEEFCNTKGTSSLNWVVRCVMCILAFDADIDIIYEKSSLVQNTNFVYSEKEGVMSVVLHTAPPTEMSTKELTIDSLMDYIDKWFCFEYSNGSNLSKLYLCFMENIE